MFETNFVGMRVGYTDKRTCILLHVSFVLIELFVVHHYQKLTLKHDSYFFPNDEYSCTLMSR